MFADHTETKMTGKKHYTIGEVAKLSGVSVRALRHYESLDLIQPERRDNGHREYSANDIARLHQVLVFRSMGLPLSQVKSSLDASPEQMRVLLEAHAASLHASLKETKEQLAVLNTALRTLNTPIHTQDEKELEAMFKDFNHEQFKNETEYLWGTTDAFAEAQRRTKTYDQAQWAQLRQEQAALYLRFYQLFSSGEQPDSEQTQTAVEDHRTFLETWFYPCPTAMHLGLADLYEGDRRFAKNIDTAGTGTATFVVAAIRASAR